MILPLWHAVNGFVGSFLAKRLKQEVLESKKHFQNSKVACVGLAVGRGVLIDESRHCTDGCYSLSMVNHFQRSKEYPFHISIGAILLNKDKKIGCHYFKKIAVPEFGFFEDFYILMRETIEPGETIENC